MASPDIEVIFNKTAVRSAEAQRLLRDWLSGASDQYPGTAKDALQVEQEETGVFTLEPEISNRAIVIRYQRNRSHGAGLGAQAQNLSADDLSGLDTLTRSEDAATAFLRQQLIGKKGKPRGSTTVQRNPVNLPGVEAGFKPFKATTVPALSDQTTSAGGRPSSKAEDVANSDDEDEIGRSGLGSKKRSSLKGRRKQSKPIAKPASTKDADVVESEEEDKETTAKSVTSTVVDDSRAPQEDLESSPNLKRSAKTMKSASRTKTRARSYLDEILAEKEAKRAKKRKQNDGQSG